MNPSNRPTQMEENQSLPSYVDPGNDGRVERQIAGEHMTKLKTVLKRIGEAAKREADLRQSILRKSALFEGSVDRIDHDSIAGWSWDSRHPGVRLSVDVIGDGKRLGTVFADEFRDDLADAGKGDGRYGFTFQTPMSLMDGRIHLLEVKIAGCEVSLNGGPVRISLAAATK